MSGGEILFAEAINIIHRLLSIQSSAEYSAEILREWKFHTRLILTVLIVHNRYEYSSHFSLDFTGFPTENPVGLKFHSQVNLAFRRSSPCYIRLHSSICVGYALYTMSIKIVNYAHIRSFTLMRSLNL